ncbi:hypothetical protein BS17DRAFT_164092 [Gyrodon lividus]|nr:hypothetical protein BS17DRAFT_164092 [Gyrodon lividus]
MHSHRSPLFNRRAPHPLSFTPWPPAPQRGDSVLQSKGSLNGTMTHPQRPSSVENNRDTITSTPGPGAITITIFLERHHVLFPRELKHSWHWQTPAPRTTRVDGASPSNRPPCLQIIISRARVITPNQLNHRLLFCLQQEKLRRHEVRGVETIAH